MESITNIFPYLYQIGVLTLLFFLLVLFYSINKRLKTSDKNQHVFNPPETNDKDKKTDNVLSELRVLIDADRITLLRFHNGQEFLPNNPVWKLTGTSIVMADGVSDEMINDLLISRIQPLISPLITGTTGDESCKVPSACDRCLNNKQCEETNRRVIGFDVEKMSGYSKSFLQKRGTRFAYLAALTNNDMKIFGVLMVEYCDSPSSDAKIAKIVQNICSFTVRLCFLFN